MFKHNLYIGDVKAMPEGRWLESLQLTYMCVYIYIFLAVFLSLGSNSLQPKKISARKHYNFTASEVWT